MLIHVAEVAVAMFLAYMAGWLVGYATHRLTAPRRPAADAAAEPAVAAAATAIGPAEAATIAPDGAGAPAAETTPEPVPAFAAKPMQMTPDIVIPKAASLAPLLEPSADSGPAARVAASDDLTALWPADAAMDEPLSRPAQSDAGGASDPTTAPANEPAQPVHVAPAGPAAAPGLAWAGEIKGHAAIRHEAPAPPAEAKFETSTPPSIAHRVEDEDAAMRAIESGWSRRSARALPDPPEATDVGVAVAAAQSAVEKALRRLEPPPASPKAEDKQ